MFDSIAQADDKWFVFTYAHTHTKEYFYLVCVRLLFFFVIPKSLYQIQKGWCPVELLFLLFWKNACNRKWNIFCCQSRFKLGDFLLGVNSLKLILILQNALRYNWMSVFRSCAAPEKFFYSCCVFHTAGGINFELISKIT